MSGLLVALLTLPWLNPFALGPSPNVQPLLLTWACAAGALGLVAFGRVRVATLWQAAVWAWALAAALSSALGLLQFLGLASDLAPWVNRPDPGTVYANLRQRNQFATLCAMGLAALVWWDTRGRAELGGAAGFWCGVAAPWVGLGLGLSGSRTGLLELLTLWALALMWWIATPLPRPRAREWGVLCLGTVGYVLAAYLLPQWLAGGGLTVFDRLLEGDAQCASRRTLWGNVWEMVMQKPWLGWGWDELAYAQFMTLMTGPRFCDMLDNAHNLPLHFAVSFGLPLAVAAVLLVLALVWRAAPWRVAELQVRLAWAVLGVIALHSLLEYPLWYGPFQLAVLLALLRLALPQANQPVLGSRRARWGGGVLALAVLALCVVVVQSYARVSRLYGPVAVPAAAVYPFAELHDHDVFLFVDEVAFSRLTVPVNHANAEEQYTLAEDLLHYSPEPRVIERLLESAEFLGRGEALAFYKARYAQAFPERFIEWLAMEPHVSPQAAQTRPWASGTRP